MSSTKLVVLKSKEIIYTAILLALIIVFIIIFINMFKNSDHADDSSTTTSNAVSQTMSSPDKSDANLENPRYTPGTYSATLNLGEHTLSVSVTVDETQITDVSFQQMDDAITTMYPLLDSSLEEINTQLHYISSVDDITPSGDSLYTTKLIIDAIKNALKDAIVN